MLRISLFLLLIQGYSAHSTPLSNPKVYVVSLFQGKTYLCEQKKYVTKPDFRKLSEKEFPSEDECLESKEFKNAKIVIKNEYSANVKKKNEARVKEIKSYTLKNPTFKKFEQTAIEGKISIGMPRELLYLSWGRAGTINTTTVTGLTREQLTYGVTYVYLDNGIVSAWQDTKGGR